MAMQMDDEMANYGKQKPKDNMQMDDEMANYRGSSSGKREVFSNEMKDYRKTDDAAQEARQVREVEEAAIRREQERAEREYKRQQDKDNREQNRLAQKELREQEKRAKKLKDAEAAAERIARHQESVNRGTTSKDFREMAHKNKGKKQYEPVPPITPKTIIKKVGDTAGGVIISTKKEMMSDGHGRSGKRLSLAYRQANRNYNSEAKRMGSQVATPGDLSAKMLFGVNKTPVRSRAKGMNQFGGVTDPLSNFASGTLLGQQTIRQDTIIEGMGRRAVQNTYAPKKKKGSDPLKSFSKMIGGF
jgi:hypothetical protein